MKAIFFNLFFNCLIFGLVYYIVGSPLNYFFLEIPRIHEGPLQDGSEAHCGLLESSVVSDDVGVRELSQQLTRQDFFKFFEVDYLKECPFWVEEYLCEGNGSSPCGICPCEEHEIPARWQSDRVRQSEAAVARPDLGGGGGADGGGWVAPDEEPFFVNLQLNPERYTGYSGAKASRIWLAIYRENCFQGPNRDCLEERVFFRLFSGLHASTTTHIASYPEFNVDFFRKVLAPFPDRVGNIHFVFAVLLRALQKGERVLQGFDYATGHAAQDAATPALVEDWLQRVQRVIGDCGAGAVVFDEKRLFASAEFADRRAWVDQFRAKFRNVSLIMDCVSCETCKVHAKLQVLGMGTAMQILLTPDSELDALRLSRNQVIALVNTVEKFADSIHSVHRFRQAITESQAVNVQGSILSPTHWREQKDMRGLLNLGFLILVVTNFRLVVENILKYGILIGKKGGALYQWDGWFACLCLIGAHVLHVVGAYLLCRAHLRGDLRARAVVWAHMANFTLLLVFPLVVIAVEQTAPMPSFILLFIALILLLKLVSYAGATFELQALEAEAAREAGYGAESLSLRALVYFVAAPTLCFQLRYPRTPSVRWPRVGMLLLQLLLCLALMMFISEQYIMPTVENSLEPLHNLAWGRLLERLLKLSIPNLYFWLVMFYAFFHVWLNLTAELLCFGDRRFYLEWWNATTMSEYWRLWNKPVNSWMRRHVYFPLRRRGYSRIQASLIIFTLSGIGHELLVSAACGTVEIWVFLAFMAQIPLILLTDRYTKGTLIGNLIFWITVPILGQPLAILIYFFHVSHHHRLFWYS